MLKSTRRRHIKRKREGKPVIAWWHRSLRWFFILILIVGVVAAANGAMIYGLNSLGIDVFADSGSNLGATAEGEGEETDSATSKVIVVGEETPSAAMYTALEGIRGGGWSVDGAGMTAVDQPLSATCPTANSEPPVSSKRITYKNKETGDKVIFTVQVYGAGMAAKQFNKESSATYSCDGENVTVSRSYSAPNYGSDAFSVTVSPYRLPSYKVDAWRDGDVIVYASYDSDSSTVNSILERVNNTVSDAIASYCANPNYASGESSRNPWSENGYTGYFERVKLNIPVDPIIVGDVQPIPADLNIPNVEPIILPTPPEAPIWPEALPDPVKMPKRISVPEFNPPTEATVVRKLEDSIGPGCGWAFSGQVAPAYDGAEVAEKYTSDVELATERIHEGQRQWAADVTAFWAKYDKYVQKAEAYNAYSDKVGKVSRAWTRIQEQRDAYAIALADYRQAKADRLAWFAARKEAKAEYLNAVTLCQIAPPTPTPTPSPTETPAPDTTVPDTFEGEEIVTAEEPTCPPLRPAILDEVAPPVPTKPLPPPDPRPGYIKAPERIYPLPEATPSPGPTVYYPSTR